MLKEALNIAGIRAFMYDFDVQHSAQAWTTMQNMLQGARYTVPIFSKGYVNSPWCLDELVLMMDTPQKVLPIFYDVDPPLDALVQRLLRCVAGQQATCAMHTCGSIYAAAAASGSG